MSSSLSETPKRVLVPIADDSEEIETSSITDVLVRFGADVVVASVKSDGKLMCKMSRGLKVCADITIEDASKEDWECIALPGGMPGAKHLRDCPTLIDMLKKQNDQKKLLGAICASPAVVLQSHGLVGEGATCYPAKAFRDTMQAPSDAKVCVTNNIVTSQGPGTSLLFALKLGEQMYGKEAADEVAAGLLVSRDTTYLGPKTGSFQNCTSAIPTIPTNELDVEHNDTGYIIVSCNLIKYRVPKSSLKSLKEESIVIGVLSGAAVQERRTWIRSTWAYNKQNIFFIVAGDFDSISDEYDEYQDLIWIDKEEVYITETSTLTFKTEAFLSIMYEKVMSEQGSKVKYLFKTDDDSYCDYNQLDTVFSKELKGADYWGKCFSGRKPNRNLDIPWQRKWYISYETYPEPEYPPYCAGAGYAISRKFLDCAVGEGHVANVRYQPNEDVAVGLLAERCNINAWDDDRVSIRWEGHPTMKNKIIQHYIKDENTMREHHRLITGVYGPKLL